MTSSMDGKKLVIIGGNSGIGRQIAARRGRREGNSRSRRPRPGRQRASIWVTRSRSAGRVGQPADISSAALLALTNPFLTGTTLHGGGRLA